MSASDGSAAPPVVSMPGMKYFNVVPIQFMNAFRAIKFIPYKFFAIVDKVNKRNATQIRVLIVTDTHLYSATPLEGSIQRCVDLKLIQEIRCSSSKLQVGLVIPEEHDFLFSLSEREAYEEFRRILPKRIVWREEPSSLASILKLEKPADFSRRSAESVRWCVSSSSVLSADDSIASMVSVAEKKRKIEHPMSETSATEDTSETLDASMTSDMQLQGPPSSSRNVQPITPRVETRSFGTMTDPVAAVAPPVVAPTSFQLPALGTTAGPLMSQPKQVVAGPQPPPPPQPAAAVSSPPAPVLSQQSADFLYREELERLQQQLTRERLRGKQLKLEMTEAIHAYHANIKVLRRNEDELRAEVERLSVENMILKRPIPEL